MSRPEAFAHLSLGEVCILRTLLPGAQLTVAQLANETRLREGTVRHGIRALAGAGFLVGGVGLRRTAWQSTALARKWASTPCGRAALKALGSREASS